MTTVATYICLALRSLKFRPRSASPMAMGKNTGISKSIDAISLWFTPFFVFYKNHGNNVADMLPMAAVRGEGIIPSPTTATVSIISGTVIRPLGSFFSSPA